MVRAAWLVLLTSVAVGLAACGARGPVKKTCYPVSGQITVKGQPAAGALVILRPKTDADSPEWSIGFPRAVVKDDGSFEVGTYGDNDGAPAGEYTVLISWQPPNPANEEQSLPDKLGGKYSDPATSPFSAKVDAGPTQLPPIKIP
jgi:hypothetical protein